MQANRFFAAITLAFLSACSGSGATVGSSGAATPSPSPMPSVTGTPSTATAVPTMGPSPTSHGVAVYETTANDSETITRKPDLAFQSGTGSQNTQITVSPGTQYQTLTAGFGVAMTDTGACLLQTQIAPGQRGAVMQQLFSASSGIGLSYVRVPMGGTDFNVSEQPYTYDDLPAGQTDPTLAHFSIDHDRAYIIPALQQALAINPTIVFDSAPWSPPAWMKTDDSLVPKTDTSTLLPQYYGPYAQYFVKFLNAYAAAGIDVTQMSVQNEPLNAFLGVPSPTIAGMTLTPVQAAQFVNDDLIPALQAAGNSTTGILAYDFVWEVDASWVPPFLTLAQSNTKAIAYHCYLSDPTTMTAYNAAYHLPQFETECASKLSVLFPAQMAIRSLRNYAAGVQLWTVAVDQNYGPKYGAGCEGLTGTTYSGQQCTAPIMVDTANGSYELSDDFWELGQFSRFIRPGAVRIDSTQPVACTSGPVPPPCGPEGVAFANADGTHVLVVTSHLGTAQTFDVVENGQHFTYTLPDGATVTFVWRPA